MPEAGRLFRRLVGDYGVRPAVEVTELGSQEFAGYVRKKIEYSGACGDRIPAYLLIPKKGRGRRRAVLALHQHNGEYELGKSEVVGQLGSDEQAYGAELAERGYVVLAPDSMCFEERQDAELRGGDYERFVFTSEVLRGSSMARRMIADIACGVDVLCARPEVNPRRIGCVGHSMGAMQTWMAMAWDRRIKAGVSSCGVSSYEALLARKINHCFLLYVPGVMRQMEVGDIIGAIAPRAYLALCGEGDPIFPVEGARRAGEAARSSYEAKGRLDRLGVEVFPVGHQFTEDMRGRAYEWLDRQL